MMGRILIDELFVWLGVHKIEDKEGVRAMWDDENSTFCNFNGGV